MLRPVESARQDIVIGGRRPVAREACPPPCPLRRAMLRNVQSHRPRELGVHQHPIAICPRGSASTPRRRSGCILAKRTVSPRDGRRRCWWPRDMDGHGCRILRPRSPYQAFDRDQIRPRPELRDFSNRSFAMLATKPEIPRAHKDEDAAENQQNLIVGHAASCWVFLVKRAVWARNSLRARSLPASTWTVPQWQAAPFAAAQRRP